MHLVLGLLGGLFSWVTTAAFAAALTVGAVLFVYSNDLPSHESLASYQPATLSRIYSGEGRIIDEFARQRRLFVPIDEVPDLVKHAFISAEDKNFYSHPGYDLRAIGAAIVEAVQTRGDDVRGASTIPQQVAKNVFLDGTRSVERKIKEIILASRMIETLGHDRVLEVYLNEIDLGQRSFGVAAAAQTYFNKSLDELTPEEAAYLGGLPQKPYGFDPVTNRDGATARRDYVLREMRQNGHITREAYETAVAEPLRTVQSGEYSGFRAEIPPRDYFTDEIRRQLTQQFGEDLFFAGGLSVRATVDPELQAVAATSLRRALEEFDRSRGIWRGTEETIPPEQLGSEAEWRAALSRADVPRDVVLEHRWHPAVVLEVGPLTARIGIEGVDEVPGGHQIEPRDVDWARPVDGRSKARVAGDLLSLGDVVLVRRVTDDAGGFVRWSLRQVPLVQGAFMAMDAHTGRVIAMQGGFSYQDSVFNRATQADRQPGSSFKPFVYAAALDSGFTPATIVVDAPIEIADGANGVWRPKNYTDRFYGPTPLRTGIEQSRNLMTVRLAQEIGMETVASYAEAFGIYDDMGLFLPNSLGSEETTLQRMLAAYAVFANGGERVTPTLVDRVQDRYGQTIYRDGARTCPDCVDLQLAPGRAPAVVDRSERVMDPITAYQMTSMMQGVVDRGTAARTVGAQLDAPIAGKTGTTNDAKDAWFVGYSPRIVAGCYIGYDQPRTLGRGATGGGLCGPVFSRFMAEALERHGSGAFELPSGGVFVNIDRRSGAPLGDGASGDGAVAEYFRQGEEPLGANASGYIDGGFAMASDLPLYDRGETQDAERDIVTSTGERTTIAPRASFGSLSAGGLY